MRTCGVITVYIRPTSGHGPLALHRAHAIARRGEPDAQKLSRPRNARRRQCTFRGIVGRFVERRWHRSPCHVLYYINNTGVKTCA